MQALRFALSKVCPSERSEESAWVRLGPELQILRFVQDDSHFDLHEWAAAPCAHSMTTDSFIPSIAAAPPVFQAAFVSSSYL